MRFKDRTKNYCTIFGHTWTTTTENTILCQNCGEEKPAKEIRK